MDLLITSPHRSGVNVVTCPFVTRTGGELKVEESCRVRMNTVLLKMICLVVVACTNKGRRSKNKIKQFLFSVGEKIKRQSGDEKQPICVLVVYTSSQAHQSRVFVSFGAFFWLWHISTPTVILGLISSLRCHKIVDNLALDHPCSIFLDYTSITQTVHQVVLML